MNKLEFQWITRLTLQVEALKLKERGQNFWREGYALYDQNSRRGAEGVRLSAEGDKLLSECSMLWAEGDRIWAEAILETFGNIIVEWKTRGGIIDCHLENGEIYKGDALIIAAAEKEKAILLGAITEAASFV